MRPSYGRRADQDALIAEAFEDDDLVGAFEEEKAKKTDEERVKDVDMTLPGWGSWAGAGIAQSAANAKKQDK